jgi:dynein heavy chain
MTRLQPDMENLSELTALRSELLRRVEELIHKVMEYRSSFDTYAYLWVDDRITFMREFLLYNHALTPEEHEMLAEGNMPERPPTLGQFKEMVRTRAHFLLLCFLFLHAVSIKL